MPFIFGPGGFYPPGFFYTGDICQWGFFYAGDLCPVTINKYYNIVSHRLMAIISVLEIKDGQNYTILTIKYSVIYCVSY